MGARDGDVSGREGGVAIGNGMHEVSFGILFCDASERSSGTATKQSGTKMSVMTGKC